MKKILQKTILIVLLLLASNIKAQQIILIPNDYSSLKEAHDAIPSVLTENVEIRLVNNGNSIPLTPISNSSFTWTKSGTNNFSIKIVSDDFDNPTTITRPSNSSHILHLKDVKNITFYNIIFENASLAFLLDNVDDSTISYCKFLGEQIYAYDVNDITRTCSAGSGTIWIGKQTWPEDNDFNNPDNKSENNIISYNFFDSPKIQNYILKHQFHSIYISNGSENNSLFANTINKPAGTGITFNHGFQNNNLVSTNLINKDYLEHEQDLERQYNYGENIDNCELVYYVRSNGYDQFINSMQCIGFGIQENDRQHTSTNNLIKNNYTYSDIHLNHPGNAFMVNDNIKVNESFLTNTNLNNTFILNHYETNKKVYDPYWLDYETDKVQDRIINGDFDKDGKMDDIVIFKKTGDNETTINTLLKRDDNSFEILTETFTGYNADLISGRLVSGDFDNDGFHNDIAVFYNYGNSETRIHLFKFNGSGFSYSGSSGWWNSEGYFADQITGRVVSGDFDNDGYHDDIAAFYDFGNSTTKLHLFKSNNSSFTYSGSSGWWNSEEYFAGQITGRVVSGDFDNDGYHDDIAAFYDYGSSATKLHMFRSNSTNFSYSGSAGWWNSQGYIANQISGRVVSGDFDNDGYHDDIAAFYDFGNSTTKLHIFKSNSNGFHYSGSSGWWQSSSYDSNNISNRLVAGDFNSDGKIDGLLGMHSYGTKRSRTHVWNKISGTNSFNYANNSLGFPWVLDYNTISNKNRVISNSSADQLNIENEIDINVYPIPAKTILNIKSNEVITGISLFDINGSKISLPPKNSTSLKEFKIDFSSLGISKGIFFIKLKTQKTAITKKVIIK